jgi:hypothetical protein
MKAKSPVRRNRKPHATGRFVVVSLWGAAISFAAFVSGVSERARLEKQGKREKAAKEIAAPHERNNDHSPSGPFLPPGLPASSFTSRTRRTRRPTRFFRTY